jgi:hypothetical protein
MPFHQTAASVNSGWDETDRESPRIPSSYPGNINKQIHTRDGVWPGNPRDRRSRPNVSASSETTRVWFHIYQDRTPETTW